MFTDIMRYILDLGPTVMLPLVIIIFSIVLGMKIGDSFKAGLHIGIGFVGIGLVIGLMLDSIGPAAKAMAEHLFTSWATGLPKIPATFSILRGSPFHTEVQLILAPSRSG